MRRDRNKRLALTKNDWRVLRNIQRACGEWDGYTPHGSRDWIGIRRLEAEVLVERSNEYAECQSCREPHEGWAFRLSIWGERVLGGCDDE